jgi:hypothetical protein
MISCVSCKSRTNDERCTNKPLKGLILCGKHAKVKPPRLWKDVNKLDCKAILIQKIWRGYSIRQWIHLAGPGVLNRSVCHNDEELYSMDDKKSVGPLDYFAFEEKGKVYWFDVRSISENCMSKLEPTNPYTREPLTIDTRQRLRKLCIKRHQRNLENVHESPTKRSVDEIISNTWIYVCQVIEENGFFGISPLYFTSLNRTQLFIFATILKQDLIAWSGEHNRDTYSRRCKYVFWMKRLIDEYARETDGIRMSYLTARVIVTILNDCNNNYPVCFMVMSTLHRI